MIDAYSVNMSYPFTYYEGKPVVSSVLYGKQAQSACYRESKPV